MSADYVQWVLTDTVQSDIWLDHWSITSQQLPSHHQNIEWKITKRTLHGGKRHGVDLIELDNGVMKLSILPTRGMGIWKGECKGIRLGWDAPIHGPVNPQWVNLEGRGGLGWLDGFDEWITRCGLAFNGPPGLDQGKQITLHGRIANTPAHFVGVRVQQGPPYHIEIVARFLESSLFGDHLHMTSVLRTTPGSSSFSIHDLVENRSSQTAEMQMLYHCNFGKPLLGEGSRVAVPAMQVAPRDAHAATTMHQYDLYHAPTPGQGEFVNYYQPLGDKKGNTLAVLHNDKGNMACSIRFNVKQLPWFIVWKNTADERDGYVTGLEPSTSFPNFKTIERNQNRLVYLKPESAWESQLTFEVCDQPSKLAEWLAEVSHLQGPEPIIVLRHPDALWSGLGSKAR